MFADLELFFDSYKHLLTGLAVLAALGGFALTMAQLRGNQAFQRETVAKTAYREYLKLCVAKPLLASGKVSKTSLNWEEYTWFVSMLLWACDEVIAYAPNDKTYTSAMKLDLAHHRTYLASAEFQSEIGLFKPALRKIIEDVVASGTNEKSADAPKLAETPKPAEIPKTEPAKA